MPLPLARFPERAAASFSPAEPPPLAGAAARPGPAPVLSPGTSAAGPGSTLTPGQPCVTPAPGRGGQPCDHGEPAHHGFSEGTTASTECSVILGPDGRRCGCTGYEAGEGR
jgi:hypothetical protein